VSSLHPSLLADAPERDRRDWSRWVLGAHSDQFLPEMVAHVEALDHVDPIVSGHPTINPGASHGDLLVIAAAHGRHAVIADVPLACRVILFDWSGEGVRDADNPHGFDVLSIATECKGHLIQVACEELGLPSKVNYVGFVDDDVVLRFSDVNTLLALARIHRLAAAQPAVSFTSSLCHEYGWLRQRACISLHRVPIVEIMAPFIRSDLLSIALPFLHGVRSGYGFDRFALPLCAAHLGDWRFAAVDLCPMTHIRPLSSVARQFSNGLQSKQEELLIRQRLMLAMGFEVDRATYGQLEAAVASGAPGFRSEVSGV
jgi:hypothetical protein